MIKNYDHKDERKKEPEEEEKVFDGDPINPGISQSEYRKIRENALEEAKRVKHVWRQKGPWVVCKSCPTRHAFWVGREKRMVGEKEDGTPIFDDCR